MEIPRHVLRLQVVQGCAKSQKPRGRKMCTSQPSKGGCWGLVSRYEGLRAGGRPQPRVCLLRVGRGGSTASSTAGSDVPRGQSWQGAERERCRRKWVWGGQHRVTALLLPIRWWGAHPASSPGLLMEDRRWGPVMGTGDGGADPRGPGCSACQAWDPVCPLSVHTHAKGFRSRAGG